MKQQIVPAVVQEPVTRLAAGVEERTTRHLRVLEGAATRGGASHGPTKKGRARGHDARLASVSGEEEEEEEEKQQDVANDDEDLAPADRRARPSPEDSEFDDELDRTWDGRWLLGYVEHREDIELDSEFMTSWWTLDAAREDHLPEALLARASLRVEGDLPPPVASVQVVVSRTYRRNEPPTLADVGEGSWGKIRLGNEGDYDAEVFRDLDGVGRTTRKMAFGGPPAGELATALASFFSLDDLPPASAAEISQVVSVVSGAPGRIVAVYDIGQGNANAICDGAGFPLVYFDLGGGCLQNAKTYPRPYRSFCFSQRQPIILSHWDFDHWFTASVVPPGQPVDWIVRNQTLSPRTLRFAQSLLAGGHRLLVWPPTLRSVPTSWGHVVACSGTSKNDSGLAVFVETSAGEYVLSPADAQFQYVSSPFPRSQPLVGLVATHHGSGHTGNPIPSPAAGRGRRVVAYSYGAGNHYKHPKSNARALYVGEGWTELDTTAGSIALPDPSPATPPCGGTSCDMLLPQ